MSYVYIVFESFLKFKYTFLMYRYIFSIYLDVYMYVYIYRFHTRFVPDRSVKKYNGVGWPFLYFSLSTLFYLPFSFIPFLLTLFCYLLSFSPYSSIISLYLLSEDGYKLLVQFVYWKTESICWANRGLVTRVMPNWKLFFYPHLHIHLRTYHC